MAGRKSTALVVDDAAEVEEVFAEAESTGLSRAEDVWGNSANDLLDSAYLEGKARLIGIPLAIVAVTYRTGSYKRPKEVLAADFVSVEGYTAPRTNRLYNEGTIRRLRERARDALTGAQISRIGFEVDDFAGPGEKIVLNDSSTGIYRQVTSYLAYKGLIRVRPPKPDVEVVFDDLKGALGSNIFDQSRDEWLDGKEQATEGIRLVNALVARQGLRVSGYENDSTQEGATFYLA